MSSLSNLIKTEYFFQPTQLFHRVLRGVQPLPSSAVVTLPWFCQIEINPKESIGRSIWDLGVLDLPATEVLWRLVRSGESAVDAGANIGVITSLLSRRVGTDGEVLAFEPHPRIHSRLGANVARWMESGLPMGPVELHSTALSNQSGETTLVETPDFERNQGVASIAGGHGSASGPTAPAGGGVRIRTVTLDSVLGGRNVGVMKMDVEGHELAVIQGGRGAFQEGRVRDLVYEDHHGYPSPVSSALESHGYSIRLVDSTFWGPQLRSPEGSTPRVHWLPPNYLASREMSRAEELCHARGWQCL